VDELTTKERTMTTNEDDILKFPEPARIKERLDDGEPETASDLWFRYASVTGKNLLDVLYDFDEFGDDPETVLLNFIDDHDQTAAFQEYLVDNYGKADE
jgi:hypothetical protein